MMNYARNVRFNIKPGKTEEFKTRFAREIVPLMKQQDGFRGEMALVDENRGIGLSFWEDEKSAETYRTSTYPDVLKKLDPVIEGTPAVDTYHVAATTLSS